jgi:hypothetical protein
MRPLDADLMRRIKMTLATSRPDKPISATQPAKSPLDRAYDELLDAAKEIAETTKKTGYIPATDQGYLLAEARIKQDLHIKPFRVSTPAPFSEVDLQEELNKPTPESPAGQFGGTMRDIALLLTEGQPFRQAIQVVLAGQAVRNPAPATLAFQAAQPLVGDRKDTRPLPIGAQLAVVFAQGQGRLFIWRLSSARPSYVPDLGQVEGLVQGDVIRARAAEAAEKKLRAIAAAIAAPNGPTLDKTVESANADLAKQLPASQPAAAAASTQPAARPTTQPGTPATAPDGNSNLKFLTVVNRVDLHRQRLSIPPIDEEGIFRQAQGDMELYKQFHHLAELQSNWELLPGDPPAEVPSRQVVKSAFDLAGQYVRREGKPDKLLSVVNDPDTAVCALLQLVDVAEPGEQKLNGSIGRMEEMFQYRLESQFRQDWFDIFHRLEYVGPKKGQQGQQGDQGE